MQKLDSSHLHDRLLALRAEACQYPRGSVERQIKLDRMVRLINQSGRLWRKNSDVYPDALQRTWLYFCRNLCEATTGECYCPEKATIFTWLNAYLKWEIHRLEIEQGKRYKKFIQPYVGSDGEMIDPVENIPSPEADSSIPPEIREWLWADPSGQLRQRHLKNRPDINCQVLLLRKFFQDDTWETLASEFNIKAATLSCFYSRHCIPKLKEFVESLQLQNLD
jgi:hypothetical protein